MSVGHFLGGVAALIWDDHGRYLLMRRSIHKDFAAGDWDCVTGRVDQGESFTEAVLREVREETGCVFQIEMLIGTTHFYRGDLHPENELLGVIYGGTIRDPEKVIFGEEHDEQKWTNIAEIEAMLPPDHWLYGIIQRAEILRSRLPDDLRNEFRVQGFEI